MVARRLKSPAVTTTANEASSLKVTQIVKGVIDDIRANGDKAVRSYSEKFDKWSPASFKLSDAQIQTELSQRIGIEKASSTAVLASLEARKFVRRVRNVVDRRKANLFLTDSGRAFLERLIPCAVAVNAVGFGCGLGGFSGIILLSSGNIVQIGGAFKY